MQKPKFTFRRRFVLGVIALFGLIAYFTSDVAYAPNNLASPIPFELSSPCYRIAHVSDKIGNGYKIGIESERRCHDSERGRFSVPNLFFNQSFLDFYLVSETGVPYFLYSEISGRMTKFGTVAVFVLFVTLSFGTFAAYRASNFRESRAPRKAILYFALAIAQLILMDALIYLSANANRLHVTNVPRADQEIILEK